MSNSIAVPGLTPVFEQTSTEQQNVSVQTPAAKPALKVVPPQSTEPPTLEELTTIYAAQHRECWLCEGVAKKIASGKEISEDDHWHFTSCVLSWEYLHRQSD